MSDAGTRAPEKAAWFTRVEAICGQRGLQLTALRRQVLDLLADAGHPLTAYAIIDQMARTQGRPIAPPTVYRTLDFLVEAGFVVKLESRNAFAICDAPGHAHHGVLLICIRCGITTEIDDHALEDRLASLAVASAFQVERQIVELQGLCARCRAA